MVLKYKLLIFLVLTGIIFFLACGARTKPDNIKDLEQNMMDIRIYQENLGDEVRAGRFRDAEWFLNGMDSILHIVSEKFTTHRKLSREFSYWYNKDLKEPIGDLKTALENNDKTSTQKSYRVLIKKCNACHIEHEIDKTVWP